MRCALLSVFFLSMLVGCQKNEPLDISLLAASKPSASAPPAASLPPPPAVLKAPLPAVRLPASLAHAKGSGVTLFMNDTETSKLALLVVEDDGSVCLLDTHTGAFRWKFPARAIDAVAGEEPGTAWVIEPATDEEEGRLLRLSVSQLGAEVVDVRPFGGLGGRLLDAGTTLLGLSQSEGATLFVSGEGEDWGRAWVTPRSVVTYAKPGAERVAYALTDDGELWRAHVTASAIDKFGPFAPQLTPGAVPQALVLAEQAPLLLVSTAGALSLLDEAGATFMSSAHSLAQGGWADEVQTSSAGAWVLAGPSAELLLLSRDQARVSLSAPLSPAPWQGRRLAVHQERAWVALGSSIVSVLAQGNTLTIDPGFTPACTGSVVTTVGLPLP